MAKAEFKSVDEYMASKPETVRTALTRVRATLRKAMPGADEVISYNMPTYRMNGEAVLLFAGWKRHYSLYAASDAIVAAFRKELAPYEIQKGTISFPLNEPVPVKLIERIAKFRAAETAERTKSKGPPRKKV
jgi:uncharacterized protein YdhG (YjbR/CyaY superfamily)